MKRFYEQLADVCKRVLGKRGWVPHEKYDPVKHVNFTPEQVWCAEHDSVSSFLRSALRPLTWLPSAYNQHP